MNIAIRADSSSIIGTGHFYRCINILSHLESFIKNYYILSKPWDNSVIDKNTVLLKFESPNVSHTLDTKTWLGGSIENDAEQVISFIKDKNIDLFIVDHYAVNDTWEKMIYPYVKKLCVLDDDIQEKHFCDILLDSKRKIPLPICKNFLGKEYAPFHKHILQLMKKNILIFLGADPHNDTMKVLQYIDSWKHKNKYIYNVVLGSTNQHVYEISEFCKKFDDCNVYYNLEQTKYLELLKQTNLCIGAGGTSTVFRNLLGVASFLISVADNQIVDCLENTVIIGTYKDDYKNKLLMHLDIFDEYNSRCKHLYFLDFVGEILQFQKRNSMIPYAKQCIDEDDKNAVLNVLDSNFLTTGPIVTKFENELCNYTNWKYAVAVNNGTSALHLACLALDLNNNDEVIVTSMSFVASSNCILYCNAKPVFCDIDPDTLCIDENKIENLITKNTKAVICVDYAGQLCNYKVIRQICNKHNLILIQDSAHSISRLVSSSGADICTFSFHPVKHITTGEGGAVMCNDVSLYNKIKKLKNHGIDKDSNNRTSYDYDMNSLGYNFRIPDILCSLGISQLQKLDKWIQRRLEIAHMYDDYLQHINGITHLTNKNLNVYHLYIIKVKDRDLCYEKFKEYNIGVNVHYKPIPMHSYYQQFNINIESYLNAKNAYEHIITLPLYPTMTNDDIYDVIRVLRIVSNL